MKNPFKISEVSVAWDRDKYGNTSYRNRFFVERIEGNCLVDYGNFDYYQQAENHIKELVYA